jgi:hypothetical protein
MQDYKTPGVYRQEVFPVPRRKLRTGVPVFLGLAKKDGPDRQPKTPSPGAVATAGRRWRSGRVKRIDIFDEPQRISRWAQFDQTYRRLLPPEGFLTHAVRGFFENGGRLCYVHMLDIGQYASRVDIGKQRLDKANQALKTIEALDIDLVCAPDLMQPLRGGRLLPDDELHRIQAAILKHCEDQNDRFAILDTPPGVGLDQAEEYPDQLRKPGGPKGANGALYYPGIRVLDGPEASDVIVPPCGHVAGVFARTDERAGGSHRAPANEILEGVVDLEVDLTDAQQDDLNIAGVNCLRVFRGRGIRVWGARTLSREPAWTYINVRRIFLTAGRWIEYEMADVVFEPHTPTLWARIRRDLSVYFEDLFQQGALKGSTPAEAFFVRCDEELNPPEVRDAGAVITEIGLAPALPSEFVVVRIMHTPSGVTITGPTRPGQETS